MAGVGTGRSRMSEQKMAVSSLFALLSAILVVTPALAARVGPVLGMNRRQNTSETYPETLDEDARIFLWRAFLTPEECDFIRMKAEKRLERSGVVDSKTGESQLSDVRTSEGMFFNRAEDAVIESIERRLADWTLTPVWNGEGLQVLRYKKQQKYDAHWDYFFDQENIRNGGNRWSTVLMYLHDNLEEGGETVFPKVPSPTGVNPEFSDCARYALAVKPRKGDAILFHSMKYNGELEDRSMHGACPVIKGEKWSMTKWIHTGHYRMGDKYDEEADRLAAKQKEFTDAGAGKEL